MRGSQCRVASVYVQAEAKMDGTGSEGARGNVQGDQGVALAEFIGILRGLRDISAKSATSGRYVEK